MTLSPQEPRRAADPVDPIPPWDRSQFRFWVWTVSTVAILTLGLSVLAVAIASPRESSTGSTTESTAPSEAARPSINYAASPPDGFEARDPQAPAPLDGTVHKITLEVQETKLEIASGVEQTMWTFGGTIPGPVFRGKVGDVFEFTLVNNGTLNHSIDFHASKVAWNTHMRSIAPGESLAYRFEAKHAGIFMYHCGTPPVIHHIGNGMYGAIIIEPPDLAPVDHEYVLVQSELYKSAGGDLPEVEPMLAEQWDAVVFNGYVNQYQHAPMRVEPDQRIRVWVLDAGPSENSSFHVIGTIFDTVYKEGQYLLRRDDPHRGGSQALDLQPAQGGFVEFSFDEPGLYPFVTHKFASASKGALGVFQAGEVSAEPASH